MSSHPGGHLSVFPEILRLWHSKLHKLLSLLKSWSPIYTVCYYHVPEQSSFSQDIHWQLLHSGKQYKKHLYFEVEFDSHILWESEPFIWKPDCLTTTKSWTQSSTGWHTTDITLPHPQQFLQELCFSWSSGQPIKIRLFLKIQFASWESAGTCTFII